MRLAELDGAVVNVEITRYPKGGLAPAGTRDRDTRAARRNRRRRRNHHPQASNSACRSPTKWWPRRRPRRSRSRRRIWPGGEDFRSLPIVTIDGETARDFDDAVHVAVAVRTGITSCRCTSRTWRIMCGAAAPLDQEARLRGTSVYFPNRAVPMLPEELSNGICSLNPKVDRLVMSVIMEMDETGKMVRSRLHAWRDSLGRADDLHERAQGARRRSGNERALRAAGSTASRA